MIHGNKTNENDEYYTPSRVFDALGCSFDLDVASPVDRSYCCVPAKNFITENSLELAWNGFVWMNPPYSGRDTKSLWLNKLANHGNGIALTPDRTSAPWWPEAAKKCDLLLLVTGKIKFIKPDGTIAASPGNGTTLFAYGDEAKFALVRAESNGLGICLTPSHKQT